MKVCSKCKEEKEVTEFGNLTSAKDGLNYWCKCCWKIKNQKWKDKNPNYHREFTKEWRLRNPESFKRSNDKYAKKNPALRTAIQNKRRAIKLNATPPWTTPEMEKEIKDLYQLAADLTEIVGLPYHVDHIHPLQGENCCGLHVPWNLEVVPASQNLKKGNRL